MEESTLNARLDGFVSVVYGAVLSFGIYVFATSSSGAMASFEPLLKGQFSDAKDVIPHIQQLALFLVTAHFLLCDYAGMVKVNSLFPYRRGSRFYLDAMIAVLYLMLFQACVNRSILFPFELALLLFLCGAWGNNLHKEAGSYVSIKKGDPHSDLGILGVVAKETASEWGRIIRNSHQLGGFILSLLTILLLLWNKETGDIARHMTSVQELVVLVTLIAWHVTFVAFAVKSSKSAKHLLLPGYLPGWVQRRLERLIS